MFALPPDGSVSVAMAALYSIAYILKKETNPIYKLTNADFLRGKAKRLSATMVLKDGRIVEQGLTVDDIYLLVDTEDPQNPFLASGVGMDCRPVSETDNSGKHQSLPLDTKRLKPITVKLKLPFDSFFPKGKYEGNIDVQIDTRRYSFDNQSDIELIAHKENPENVIIESFVYIPHLRDAIFAHLRQAMASSSFAAHLVDEDGIIVDIPANFWRIEKSKRVLKSEIPISLSIDADKRVGEVFVKLSDVKKHWDTFYDQDNSEDFANLGQRDKLSPYIEFMMLASTRLGYIEGKPQVGPIRKSEEIVQWLLANWPPELGNPSSTMAGNMATFIRDPEAARGGNRKVAHVGQKPPVESQRSIHNSQDNSGA